VQGAGEAEQRAEQSTALDPEQGREYGRGSSEDEQESCAQTGVVAGQLQEDEGGHQDIEELGGGLCGTAYDHAAGADPCRDTALAQEVDLDRFTAHGGGGQDIVHGFSGPADGKEPGPG